MEEILFELREHSDGLNAGRWDYIFSLIKTLGRRAEFVLPDRSVVTTTAPFMAAYSELLVRTCHARGEFVMGGNGSARPLAAPMPPSPKRAVAAVREDKRREAAAGFDGTWVAHPDVVPVAMQEFDAVLDGRPDQSLARQRPDVTVSRDALLAMVASTPGHVTESGLRNNISVAFQYISVLARGPRRGGHRQPDGGCGAWPSILLGRRSWQWIDHATRLPDGRVITRSLVGRPCSTRELDDVRRRVGDEVWERGRPAESRAVFTDAALEAELPDFLTAVAYPFLLGDPAGTT